MIDYQKRILFLIITELQEMDVSYLNIGYDGQGVNGWSDMKSDWGKISDGIINMYAVEILNRKGIKTARGKVWTKRRWREFRYSLVASICEDDVSITRRGIEGLLEESGLDGTLYKDREDDLTYKQRDYGAFRAENVRGASGISGCQAKVQYARWSSV
jgi:hypothetical protein